MKVDDANSIFTTCIEEWLRTHKQHFMGDLTFEMGASHFVRLLRSFSPTAMTRTALQSKDAGE